MITKKTNPESEIMNICKSLVSHRSEIESLEIKVFKIMSKYKYFKTKVDNRYLQISSCYIEDDMVWIEDEDSNRFSISKIEFVSKIEYNKNFECKIFFIDDYRSLKMCA